ncbi:MAG: hypothetical protein HY669_02865 [Chloroflexi bacterium]|nr:hypothetical protein [Chloroflexota bacterium]
MTNIASERLKASIGALARSRAQPVPDVSPGCTFGAVVDERLRHLERSLQEVKQRLNGLIFVVIGAVLVEIATSLLG